MAKFQIVHTDPDLHPLNDLLIDSLQQAGANLILFRPGAGTFAAVAAGADAILNSDFKLTAPMIASLRRCRIISHFGTGVDNIDIETATKHGIPVANVPDFCAEEVANRTWALLLGCSCQIVRSDQSIRRGLWRPPGGVDTLQIEGQTLGLVGFGRIGRAVARRARCFGMKVIAHDQYLSEIIARSEGVAASDLETVFRTSDYVSLHVPLTPQTFHLVNPKTLSLMKPTAILLNTARGGLVDEVALAEQLRRGQLAGAGLDVFELEPPQPDNPLLVNDRVILTPHSAALTSVALERVRTLCVDAVVRSLSGKRPLYVVNPSVFNGEFFRPHIATGE
jgi:D-3-phosphoglycerate dehydrogenase